MAEDSEVSSGRVGTGSGKRPILNPRYQKSLGLFGVYLGAVVAGVESRALEESAWDGQAESSVWHNYPSTLNPQP